ncbi:MAG: hypothetical protein LH468_06865 [Nocardioides sp.]|nr:hypothetical protein [Nocardioides sp.]
MTQHPDPTSGQVTDEVTDEVTSGHTGLAPTGNDAVDAVLDAVADLDGRPLEEHAQVFETAQERLRHALDLPHQGS